MVKGTTMLAKDLSVNSAGEFIFGVGGTFVAVDPRTGTEKWAVDGPYSPGIVIDTPETLVLKMYTEHGYGDGYALFEKSGGQRLTPAPLRSVAVDPVKSLAAVSYTTTKTYSNNIPPDVPGTPAYEVLDLATGNPVFSLSRDEAEALGQIEVIAAFDGRVILTVDDGLRIVNALTGDPDPTGAAIQPGRVVLSGVPRHATTEWALLRKITGSILDDEDRSVTQLIHKPALSWADLGTTPG